jgi:Spy/CpxP family protein refolding chaperone
MGNRAKALIERDRMHKPQILLPLELAVHRIIPWLWAVCFVVPSAQAQAPAQQTSATAAPGLSDSVLKDLRADMQSSRADILAKNLTLTAGQAAKFWPVFDAYQKEQNAIMDAQLKGLQKYMASSETLDDAAALSLMDAHLERDAKMTALRRKWLKEFQKVLPPKLAVRAMQIDRRLSLVAQMEVAAQLPLAH